MSLPSSLLGRHRPGLVTAHADPGKGHPASPGGEGPPGSGPHWLWEDGCLCHSDAAAAAPREGGGSRRGPKGGEGGAVDGVLVVPSWKGVIVIVFPKNQAFLWPLKPVRDGRREPGAVVADVLGWTSGRPGLSPNLLLPLCNLE